MNRQLDAFFTEARRWRAEAERLRSILLDCGLDEELKWRQPCYTHEGKNIVIMQSMKAFLSLMFFKGALLKDPHGVLREQGKNTRSARRLCFTSVQEVVDVEAVLRAYVAEAITVEKAGLTVPESTDTVLVDELEARLDADPTLRAAFEALTPGRQRHYNLHVSAAKQSDTRARRVERCIPRIVAGKGLRDT